MRIKFELAINERLVRRNNAPIMARAMGQVEGYVLKLIIYRFCVLQ
jgi:hypothetical protein